eukprot:TRINITY_DN1737_c0_g1_i2.p1 TRINITY_DN1737_c0_g1~~TRINITY_DN1737_c0_g1_i2.p1  ORF type:complete len:603 (+),score=141.24 TRINITY_DN1737_c0_g1_i2:84-1811(+)
MATFREHGKPVAAMILMLVAAALTVSTCFNATPQQRSPQLRSPVLQLGVGPRRAPDLDVESGFTSNSFNPMVLAAAAAVLFSVHSHREKVQRKCRRKLDTYRTDSPCIDGYREMMVRAQNTKIGNVMEDAPGPDEVANNFYPGQHGMRGSRIDPRYSSMEMARMSLGKVDKALRKWKIKDFNHKTPKASLAAADVKEVGTCMTKGGAPDEVIVPAQVPAYKKPKTGVRLEKEPGPKRPPKEDDAYVEYIQKRFGLVDDAKKAGVALDKDIVCERSSLLILLSYLMGDLSELLMRKGCERSPVDLIKITKNENGQGIVMERIYEKKNLWAGHRKYEVGWVRQEMSNRGTYTPAWQRLCTEGKKHMSYMCTGLRQVAGVRNAGEMDSCHRFVEYDMGGLSFVTKVPAHAKDGDMDVELAHKNWYHQDEVRMINTYWQMLLGKTDKFVLGLHRSGLMHEVVEVSIEDIKEKKPGIVEAAETRLGWLTELLKQVKEAVSSDGDGPWVLQWKKGTLSLGKYELVEAEEGERVKKKKVKDNDLFTPLYMQPKKTRYEQNLRVKRYKRWRSAIKDSQEVSIY